MRPVRFEVIPCFESRVAIDTGGEKPFESLDVISMTVGDQTAIKLSDFVVKSALNLIEAETTIEEERITAG